MGVIVEDVKFLSCTCGFNIWVFIWVFECCVVLSWGDVFGSYDIFF